MEYLNIPRQESHITTELLQYPSSELGEQSQYTPSELGEWTSTQLPSSGSKELVITENNSPLSKKELGDLRRREKKELREHAENLNVNNADEARCKNHRVYLASGANATTSQRSRR